MRGGARAGVRCGNTAAAARGTRRAGRTASAASTRDRADEANIAARHPLAPLMGSPIHAIVGEEAAAAAGCVPEIFAERADLGRR